MRAKILAGLLILMGCAQVPPAQAQNRIELDLATEQGFPALDAQKWLRMLTEVGFAGLNIRAGRPGDKTKIISEKRGGGNLYKVTGILTARNELLLPGGRFSLRDSGRINDWATLLSEQGPDAGPPVEKPFGLDDADFKKVHRDLAKAVSFSTVDQTATKVVRQIGEALEATLEISRQAENALEASDPVAEELQGLGSGTALAYVLRSAGLGLIPKVAGKGQISYSVSRPGEKEQSWPIGLPAEAERNKLVPKLLEFLNVEVDEIPLSDVMGALGERLETPFLLDHIALVTRRIDPQQVVVSLPPKRTSYSTALRQLLGKGRLKWEMRVDDAGKPFIWVTTMVPVD
ncbi:MAG: hypothetical protein AB7O62_26650 [Pirellulales bacterium]